MFDPLLRHYQRLYNIKPSAEIASVIASNNKRRKKQKIGSSLNHTLGNANQFGKPRRPHSSLAAATYTNFNNSSADGNNNYNSLRTYQHNTNILNKNIGSKPSSSWTNVNHHDANFSRDWVAHEKNGDNHHVRVRKFIPCLSCCSFLCF